MPSFPSRLLRLCRLDMCSGLHNRAQEPVEALCSWVSLHPRRLWPARPHVLFCTLSRATSQPHNLRQIVLFNHTDLLKIHWIQIMSLVSCECYLLSKRKESWSVSGSVVGAKRDSLYHRTSQLPPALGEDILASIFGCIYQYCFMSSMAKLSCPFSWQCIFSDYRALINERESMPIPVLYFGCYLFVLFLLKEFRVQSKLVLKRYEHGQ